MDFDKDNFEEDNELAPLEEEEAGDADEVAGVEIDEIVVGDDTEDESEVPKRASSGPKRGSASTSSKASAGRGSSRSSGGKSRRKKLQWVKAKAPPRNRRRRNPAAREERLRKNRPRKRLAAARKRSVNFPVQPPASLRKEDSYDSGLPFLACQCGAFFLYLFASAHEIDNGPSSIWEYSADIECTAGRKELFLEQRFRPVLERLFDLM